MWEILGVIDDEVKQDGELIVICIWGIECCIINYKQRWTFYAYSISKLCELIYKIMLFR